MNFMRPLLVPGGLITNLTSQGTNSVSERNEIEFSMHSSGHKEGNDTRHISYKNIYQHSNL